MNKKTKNKGLTDKELVAKYEKGGMQQFEKSLTKVLKTTTQPSVSKEKK